jgi:hypothetical protein
MSQAGFEHAIRTSERPQTQALDRAASGKNRGIAPLILNHGARRRAMVNVKPGAALRPGKKPGTR